MKHRIAFSCTTQTCNIHNMHVWSYFYGKERKILGHTCPYARTKTHKALVTHSQKALSQFIFPFSLCAVSLPLLQFTCHHTSSWKLDLDLQTWHPFTDWPIKLSAAERKLSLKKTVHLSSMGMFKQNHRSIDIQHNVLLVTNSTFLGLGKHLFTFRGRSVIGVN